MSEDIVEHSDLAGEEFRPNWRRRLAAWLRRALTLGILLLIAATFMPLFHPLWPMTAVTEHFALQMLTAAVVLGLLALALRRWRWFGLVIAVALIQVWIIHPYLPSFTRAQASPQTSGTGLKIVSLNVWYRSAEYETTRRYLAESGADVIGLVEVTPEWKRELAALANLYPYRVDCVDSTLRCEEMLLSKHPILRSGAGWIDEDLPILAWAEIAPPDGTGPPVTFAVTHLAWPLLGARPTLPTTLDNPTGRNRPLHPDDVPHVAQSEQAENLLAGLEKLGPDLVLMGDFNAAPWSRTQRHFRTASGLDNQGFVAPSWPTWGPAIIRLPIDHIMTRGKLRLDAFRTGPDVGSDHLPVEAMVSFAEAPALQ